MTATMKQFRQKASKSISDDGLQISLENATGRFREAREKALAALPNVEAMRDHFKKIRSATLADLSTHLLNFEKNAQNAGARVHWARTGEEAAEIVTKIAQDNKVDLVVKSKSMATEEIHLNQVLGDASIVPVETDLGEWIVQLAHEPPSHIIAPAIHKTKEQVAEIFTQLEGNTVPADIPTLTLEARRILREKFLTAGMGVSGGNIAVAETGSVVIVTNEGNGRMVTSLPPVHIVVIGIEKIAPNWDEAAVWLSLLARSATGQPLSIYTNVITGPAREDDPDGPHEVHIVLLDNNRSKLLGTKYEEILQCIRCGACLNVCPVYRESGGHAYGSPYSGPIGAVISPLLFGMKEYEGLPQASSLCGACLDVCPARIDLPRMLLELRRDQVEDGILPWFDRFVERSAAWVINHSNLYKSLLKVARLLRLSKVISFLTKTKTPSLADPSFREMWQSGDLEELL